MSQIKRWLNEVAAAGRGAARVVGGFWSRTQPQRHKWRLLIVGAVLFLAALTTVIALLPGEMNSAVDRLSGSGDEGEGSWEDLQLQRPVSLTNGELRQTRVGSTSRWVKSTLPQIDFTVRNDGEARIPLDRVRLEVTNSARLTSCLLPQGEEGEIPVAEAFTVDLPLLPVPDEEVVYRSLHQEALPHRAVRFKLYLRSMEGGFGDNLFAVDVSLQGTQPGEARHVGRFVLSLPGAISWSADYFPSSPQAFEGARRSHSLLPTTWCYRRNLATVGKFLSLPGKRSPAIQALSLAGSSGNWNKWADRRPAAAAVGPLLHSGDFFLGPVLALFAAQRTKDATLIADTRRRAAALLRQSIERSLAEDPPPIPVDLALNARVLAQLDPSDEATLLLKRSESALRASEESSGKVAG